MRIQIRIVFLLIVFSFFILAVSACNQSGSDTVATPRASEAKPVNSLVLAGDSDAWGGDALQTGKNSILAVALHRKNQFGVWSIDRQRKVTSLGQPFSVGYHPDGVAMLGSDRAVIAVEGEREYAIWAIAGKEPRELSRAPSPFPARDVVVGDFDGDGVLDLVFAPYIGEQLAILWGDKPGYSSPQFVSAGLSPWHPVVYDWNQDGIDDILWAELETGRVCIAFGSSERNINTNALYEVQGKTARHLAVGDVDGDGRADLLVAVEVGDSKLLLSRENDAFEVIPFSPEKDHIGYVSAAVIGDGVVAFADEKRVVLAHYQATGHDDRKYLSAGSLPTPMITPDLDGDGIRDLVVFNSAGGGVTIHFGPVWEQAQNEKITY